VIFSANFEVRRSTAQSATSWRRWLQLRRLSPKGAKGSMGVNARKKLGEIYQALRAPFPHTLPTPLKNNIRETVRPHGCSTNSRLIIA
jgi:hypothetical protein